MKIAILGWGSLIWRPENLSVKSEWLLGGPYLPIEFARISSDGRLTLVVKTGATEIQTMYAISKFETLDEAVFDLAVREGCGKNKIGYCIKNVEVNPNNFNSRNNLISWLNDKDDIDAVIWTNLSANFKEKIDIELNNQNAVNYLKYLPQDVQAKAEEYIRKAPAIVNTPIRRAIEVGLGWKIIV